MPPMAPNTARLKIKISWLTMETPDICSVPSAPTIRLSSMLTRLVIKFCSMMGRATVSVIL